MLTTLAIRNVVLIEALDLAFARGLGVLTGETGAGKSILLDALGLVLGNRADGGLIRAGEDSAGVTATFEFATLPDGLAAALDEAGVEVEAGEALVLRRQLKTDGASKAFVNGQPVGVATYSAAVLKSWGRAKVIGALLVGLYALLYFLLNMEAWSLLIGSVLLFFALAGVMYATRKVDWQGLGLRGEG